MRHPHALPAKKEKAPSLRTVPRFVSGHEGQETIAGSAREGGLIIPEGLDFERTEAFLFFTARKDGASLFMEHSGHYAVLDKNCRSISLDIIITILL